MYSLGIDVGSSSIKVSLLDIEKGICVTSSTNPKVEMPISAPEKGFVEQDPEMWWKYIREGVEDIGSRCDLKQLVSIGISYQMHGLVALGQDGRPVRDAIIWCDSRAVSTGADALQAIGYDRCMTHLLNSPGNFTASKLAWVKRNEPEVYAKIWRFMLPGDYVAYRLTGELTTTATGMSEGILWDFVDKRRAHFVADYFGIESDKFCPVVQAIGIQGRTTPAIEEELGIPAGTPVSYRAGDQPNNAFSLDVLEPGEIAATGGTSGVVYGVTDVPKADPQSRVNTFLHVTSADVTEPRLGVLLCINGTGIMNSWMRRNVALEGATYPEINDLAESAPIGADGISILPFGNGAERLLENGDPGCSIHGVNFNRHGRPHLMRAAQEGIVFAFQYGIELMQRMGLKVDRIHAGRANMFQSKVFRDTLAGVSGATIELYDTEGSAGAAKGAGIGAGIYKDNREAFSTLERLDVIYPQRQDEYRAAYEKWKSYITQ